MILDKELLNNGVTFRKDSAGVGLTNRKSCILFMQNH
jgi:hypothetical protein